jgi:hypothetical protein
MARQRVRFDYHTGLRRDAFGAAELTGSWDRQGRVRVEIITPPVSDPSDIDRERPRDAPDHRS